MKITVPFSNRDKTSMSSMSKHSHDTDSVLRKKSKTIPGPLFKGNEVTQEEYDFIIFVQVIFFLSYFMTFE